MTRRGPDPHYKQSLLDRASAEAEAAETTEFVLPVVMDIQVLSSLVGTIHLALRHPGFHGPSAEIVRTLARAIATRMEELGYLATAELMRLGENPDFDVATSDFDVAR